MARTAETVLEFDGLLEMLRRRTTCAPGRRAVDGFVPRGERAELEAEFALVSEAREWLRWGGEMGFGGLADPREWMGLLVQEEEGAGGSAAGAILEPKQLLDAASLLETAAWLKQQFPEDVEEKYPRLAARANALGNFQALLGTIKRAILPNGEISDDASPALRRIRASVVETRESVQKLLKQILRKREAAGGEDYVTLRGDRFVIPVRAENRRAVPGVVHGASGTGQTLFVEPLEALDANNQLVQLNEEEAAEILRILQELTRRLQMELGGLRAAAETIAEMDGVFARGRFAREFDAAIPEFSEAGALQLVEARHPVLEDKLRRENRAIVPMTLALGGDERVLVISGPNTGGKTVALKTTGMAALAAQAGIPVTAQRAVLPLFDRVLVDIGDEQSIAADLSTFSAHMVNLKAMLEAATPRSLVLVDEMGTGTAPEEGAALAVALLDEFRGKNCIVLATTHHDRLKTYASTTAGVVNAAVEFDEVNLRPTYRLMVGVPGGSSGIAIAKRLGIGEAVIERARALLSPETLEAADLIAYLHRSRDELDRMRAQMNEERRGLEEERKKLRGEWVARQQKRIAELEAKFAEMQKRFDANVASVVEAVKERELRGQLEKTARRKMQEARGEAKEELNAAVVQTLSESQADLGAVVAPAGAVSAERLVPGARLIVKGFRQPVVLRRLEGTSAEVEAGPLRMKIAVEEITGIEAGGGKVSRGVTVTAAPGEGSVSNEINLIGMRVEQAIERVDKFLDEAVIANQQRVRIIHGHGTGALRKGLAEFLKTHPSVESFEFEVEERGGKAVTVVELRT
ncbi:MAG: Smr/MutS family protein [Acidobacteriia bacterium]|nr:Smr/MutS family protein [Terriglobia bacterium]